VAVTTMLGPRSCHIARPMAGTPQWLPGCGNLAERAEGPSGLTGVETGA
jgi:hypothetical protein